MRLLDFPNLHCPRCAVKYEVLSLTGWGTLVMQHPANGCMDDNKEARVSAKEIDVEPVPLADVQQAQVARDFNKRVAKSDYIDKGAALPVGGYAYDPCIGDYVPTGYVPRVKIDEPVKDRPLYSGQHCTDRGDKLTQAADGNWYYA